MAAHTPLIWLNLEKMNRLIDLRRTVPIKSYVNKTHCIAAISWEVCIVRNPDVILEIKYSTSERNGAYLIQI